MTNKQKSIVAVACQALGIERQFLPEKLRNRLNYYVGDKGLKDKLIDEASVDSESIHNKSKPIKNGNHIFIRNLVILDTLFEDRKVVVKWLNGEPVEASMFDRFASEWKAKKVLFEALDKKVVDIRDFLLGENKDWSQEEIPYPFNGGKYSSIDMIAKSIEFDVNPSAYDLALKAVLGGEFGKLGQLITENPEHFVSAQGEWLIQLYDAKKTEYEDYAKFLNKY